METTHIRVTKEMKSELMDCDGQNFDERIKNYNQDSTNDVNTDVNTDQIVNKLKEELSNDNNTLTLPEIKSAVEDALKENLTEQALDMY